MSKLELFLKESITIGNSTYTDRDVLSFNKAWATIQKECKQFLKEVDLKKHPNNLLFRGSGNRGNWFMGQPRRDRYPKDTPDYWHEAFNEVFKDKFGWYARSEGLFTTGNYSTAKSYGGKVYIIFPAGRYKYVWSSVITDLYREIEDDGLEHIKPSSELISEWEQEWQDTYNEPGSGYGNWFYDFNHFSSTEWDRDTAVKNAIEELTDDQRAELENYYEILETEDENMIKRHGGEEHIRHKISLIEDEIQDIKDSVEDNLEWVPDVSIDEFLEERESKMSYDDVTSDMVYDAAERIIGNKYKDKNIVDAITLDTEIMIKCDKYYAVSYSFLDLIKNAIVNGTDDPRQMKFDF